MPAKNPPKLSPKKTAVYELTNHICRQCANGRILLAVGADSNSTLPAYRCATCMASSLFGGVEKICYCGITSDEGNSEYACAAATDKFDRNIWDVFRSVHVLKILKRISGTANV